jgi:ABC-type branched-subunit amino acid transport system permease subunit
MTAVKNARKLPGMMLLRHAIIVIVVGAIFLAINTQLEPTFSFYLAQAAMYATAMFGMVILVGLSGQVSLGNGALMAVGAYTFALTSLHWETVPLLGLPWNAVWSVVAAGLVGILAGLIIGGLGARLAGPYLAGLTLGIAVGLPAIIYRFPSFLGGEDGFALRVPYPAGGYAASTVDAELAAEFITEGPPVADVFEEFLDQEGDGAEEEFDDVLEFDQDELATEQEPGAEDFDDDELLEFDQDELMSDIEEETSDPLESEESLADGGDVAPDSQADGLDAQTVEESVDLVDGTGFILEQWQASLAILMACIVAFLALNLIRSQQGRKWQAVRDDPVAASLVGVPNKWTKVSAFVMSGFFAALAGAVYAQILSYVGPTVFGLGLSLSLLVGVILGGRASLVGAMVGAAFIVLLPVTVKAYAEQLGWSDQIAGNLPDLIYGLLVVVVVLVLPAGLVGAGIALWRRRKQRQMGRVSGISNHLDRVEPGP